MSRRHTKSRKTRKKEKVIEHGDIFFFYRPKVGTEEVNNIEDVQRFYMVTSPDNSNIHRVFLIGQKQLPQIIEGRPDSEERNWALNIVTSSHPDEVRKEFLPVEYKTQTRGTEKNRYCITSWGRKILHCGARRTFRIGIYFRAT